MHRAFKSMLYKGFKRVRGSQFFPHLHWFMENQYRPFYELKREQDQLLIKLLREAYNHAPGYRERLKEAGVYYQGDIILSNFQEIPPLTKADLLQYGEAFTHVRAFEHGATYYSTGGSTGNPIKIAQDPRYRDWSQASTAFFYTWSGLEIGTPYFLLWAAYRDVRDQLSSLKGQLLMGYLQGRRILNCRIASADLFSEFIETINQQQDCHYLVGYASELYALACHSLENNLPINRPLKAVYSTAENLTEKMRSTIEVVFGCKVYNRYGCRDAGDFACECEYQQGLHINPLYAHLEIADESGNRLPYGEEGQILVTSLHNYAMPLIRYAVGDRGVMKAPERCRCGRAWQGLVQITGRTCDKIYLPDGARFGGAFLHTALDPLPNLQQYQIHQMSTDMLIIKLRSSVPNYVEQYREHLIEATCKIQAWANYPMKIEYEQTDELEKTPTGKELLLIHKFNPQSVPNQAAMLLPT